MCAVASGSWGGQRLSLGRLCHVEEAQGRGDHLRRAFILSYALTQEVESVDLSDFAYVGEGFSKSDRYVEFQDRIRHLPGALAEKLAAADRTATTLTT